MRHTGLPLFPRGPLSPGEPGGPCCNQQKEPLKNQRVATLQLAPQQYVVVF